MMPFAPEAGIRKITQLVRPIDVICEYPGDARTKDLVHRTRDAIRRILRGEDNRLIVVIGPCSIHDPKGALEYAARLADQRSRFAADLEVVMRVYLEKPRTTVSWKGLINDPYLDQSYEINDGVRIARQLLVRINSLGVPAATEYLDVIGPHYLADLISWGAIGARTTESQVHRELASGLSSPIGFKNGTDGNLKIAIDAITAASHPHHFRSVTASGQLAIASTTGNADCHVVLRGGRTPNYDARSVDEACASLAACGLPQRLMIDASHANSRKNHLNQVAVCEDLAGQVSSGDARIIGVMIEANLVAGRQDVVVGRPLTHGQSVTDACLGWDDSIGVLSMLAAAVRRRDRLAVGSKCNAGAKFEQTLSA